MNRPRKVFIAILVSASVLIGIGAVVQLDYPLVIRSTEKVEVTRLVEVPVEILVEVTRIVEIPVEITRNVEKIAQVEMEGVLDASAETNEIAQEKNENTQESVTPVSTKDVNDVSSSGYIVIAAFLVVLFVMFLAVVIMPLLRYVFM